MECNSCWFCTNNLGSRKCKRFPEQIPANAHYLCSDYSYDSNVNDPFHTNDLENLYNPSEDIGIEIESLYDRWFLYKSISFEPEEKLIKIPKIYKLWNSRNAVIFGFNYTEAIKSGISEIELKDLINNTPKKQLPLILRDFVIEKNKNRKLEFYEFQIENIDTKEFLKYTIHSESNHIKITIKNNDNPISKTFNVENQSEKIISAIINEINPATLLKLYSVPTAVEHIMWELNSKFYDEECCSSKGENAFPRDTEWKNIIGTLYILCPESNINQFIKYGIEYERSRFLKHIENKMIEKEYISKEK